MMQGTRTQINSELASLRQRLNTEIEQGGKTIEQMLETVDAIHELELLQAAMVGVKHETETD